MKTTMSEILTTEDRIRQLIAMYEERRTDVADNLESLLYGTPFVPPEHRNINAQIPGYRIYYDTLTTLIEYKREESDEWMVAENHIYYDDETPMQTLADYCREINQQEADKRRHAFEALVGSWESLVRDKIKETLETKPSARVYELTYQNGIRGRDRLKLPNNNPEWSEPSDEYIHEFFRFLVPKLAESFGMHVYSVGATLFFKW